ncbi:MAG: SAM-dependent methyltransferase [Burkholderiales bacterium]|nr:SAM-dependent methyltransferase [Burkholderiales bacterium]
MPGYHTKQERIAVAGCADLLIHSLLDRQQFADPLGEAAGLGISDAQWSLFGQAWPSSALLAARLALRPVAAAERILEVGCGLALASLVGHRRGADVTASDNHPLAGAFLAENLRLNDLAPMKYRHGDWGEPAGKPTRRIVRGRFDLIIGSDVLYDRDASRELAAFIGRHAEAAAEVWIVDPERGNRPAFNRSMSALGFERSERRLDHAATPLRAAYKGRLLEFSRLAPGRARETARS